MSIGLLIVTDGRDYLRSATYANWCQNLDASTFAKVVCVNDSGSLAYADDIEQLMPDVHDFVHHPQRRGLAQAVRSGWQQFDTDYLLHLEDDFLFHSPPPLTDMQHALERLPNLSQVVLKRQPWSVEERAAGGIIEMHPDLYEEVGFFGRSYRVSTHRRIFSLNPCLIPRRVFTLGWPDSNEAGMTDLLNVDTANRFAFYGGMADPPRVEHVGSVRGQGWAL